MAPPSMYLVSTDIFQVFTAYPAILPNTRVRNQGTRTWSWWNLLFRDCRHLQHSSHTVHLCTQWFQAWATLFCAGDIPESETPSISKLWKCQGQQPFQEGQALLQLTSCSKSDFGWHSLVSHVFYHRPFTWNRQGEKNLSDRMTTWIFKYRCYQA